MQITIRLKGLIRILLVSIVILVALAYGIYKAYNYISYRKIMYDTDQKIKHKLKFETYVKVNDHSKKGYLLLSSITGYHGKNYSSLIIMNTDGQVLWERQMEGIIYDFRPWHTDSGTFYSYAINDRGDSAVSKLSSCGRIVILDSSLNEVKQIHLKPYGDVVIDKRQDLDLHDFILLSCNHYITMASYAKAVNNIPASLFPAKASRVFTPVIQELRNDSVIWQWEAAAYPEFYLSSNGGNRFYDTTAVQDYIHMNSMIIDPRDSNLILSLLNQNQIIKIDRHTGKIMWRLGGKNSDFPLKPEQVFLRQHNATLIDSNHALLLLDNGADSIRAYSRILEFKLDEQNKTITSFKSYNVPARIIGSRGSVQKINGDYLICGGISDYVLIANSVTGVKNVEIKADQSFYRAYWVEEPPHVKLNRVKAQ